MRAARALGCAWLLPVLLPALATAGPLGFHPPGRIVPSAIGVLFSSAPAPARGWKANTDLESSRGRQVLEFAPDQLTDALFLAVAGSVQFERIQYALDDGVVHSLDVFGEVREHGLYELATLGGTHRVLWVRVTARALSRHAELGLRLALV
jgi:hypothetical protein